MDKRLRGVIRVLLLQENAPCKIDKRSSPKNKNSSANIPTDRREQQLKVALGEE